MRGDQDELGIFLKICLIPSRIDQKLSFKGRIHHFLKGKLGSKAWVMEAIVEGFDGVEGAIPWA